MRTTQTLADGGAESVVERIAAMIEDVITQTSAETGAERADFLGVGIGSPGPLDREKGIVIVTPNLGWKNFPLRDEIAKLVRLDATLDNDANCATLGEFWCGAAVGGKNVIGITLGTGIGGGLILDGKLYHGSSDAAGEIGHTTIDSTGRRCKCGNYGCLEAYASGPAIAERAREALRGDESETILQSMVGGDIKRITAQTVYEASKRGDALAREVVRETARFLGAGVSNLLNIFNPDVVVLAGGVTQAGDALFEPLRAEVRRRAFKPAVDACRIVPGALPLSAGVVGAIATFKMKMFGDL
jgi:glucokinase